MIKSVILPLYITYIHCKGAMMVRTQVYLTDMEKNKLCLLSDETGQSQSELIREAIDQFVDKKIKQKKSRCEALRAAKGLWQNREDLLDFSNLRKEWDER